MKIIIIGNGKVGFTLAKQLSVENHELVLIDHNAEALKNADSALDILCTEGSGASIQVLKGAGVRDAELVVAVTGSDELNIVCCLIAKKLGARHTVARIRSPEYQPRVCRGPGNLPAAAGPLRLQRGDLCPGAGGADRFPGDGERRPGGDKPL